MILELELFRLTEYLQLEIFSNRQEVLKLGASTIILLMAVIVAVP
jgi:hypothetical protein